MLQHVHLFLYVPSPVSLEATVLISDTCGLPCESNDWADKAWSTLSRSLIVRLLAKFDESKKSLTFSEYSSLVKFL